MEPTDKDIQQKSVIEIFHPINFHYCKVTSKCFQTFSVLADLHVHAHACCLKYSIKQHKHMNFGVSTYTDLCCNCRVFVYMWGVLTLTFSHPTPLSQDHLVLMWTCLFSTLTQKRSQLNLLPTPNTVTPRMCVVDVLLRAIANAHLLHIRIYTCTKIDTLSYSLISNIADCF